MASCCCVCQCEMCAQLGITKNQLIPAPSLELRHMCMSKKPFPKLGTQSHERLEGELSRQGKRRVALLKSGSHAQSLRSVSRQCPRHISQSAHQSQKRGTIRLVTKPGQRHVFDPRLRGAYRAALSEQSEAFRSLAQDAIKEPRAQSQQPKFQMTVAAKPNKLHSFVSHGEAHETRRGTNPQKSLGQGERRTSVRRPQQELGEHRETAMTRVSVELLKRPIEPKGRHKRPSPVSCLPLGPCSLSFIERHTPEELQGSRDTSTGNNPDTFPIKFSNEPQVEEKDDEEASADGREMAVVFGTGVQLSLSNVAVLYLH